MKDDFMGGVDRPDEDIERRSVTGCGCIFLIAAVMLACSMMLIMCGCKTVEVVKEVPVITEHTTHTNHVDIVRDTLIRRDSVYHYIHGDTVIIERWHQVEARNVYQVADTVRDTVPQIVTVTQRELVEVEKKLTRWQRLKIEAGGMALAVAGAAILAGIAWLVLWIKKKKKIIP